MKILIKEVNCWEIWYDENSIAPYQIRYGDRYNQYYCWKTLKAAEKWAMTH